mgnify:CR=1 FL=1
MNKTDQILELCIKNDERLKTLFNSVNKIEIHLDKLNGKVAEHEKFKIQIKSAWIVITILTPLAFGFILKVF